MSSTSARWPEENQRGLMAAVGDVRAAVEALLGHGGTSPARMPGEPPAALETLCATFGLTAFERRILLLCAGIELDSKLASLCAARPTFSLALAAFDDAHWSALCPSRPLRYWRLVEVMPGDALTTSPLRIDERILHYLAGVQSVDERLRPLVKPAAAPQRLAPSHRELAEQAAAVWSRARDEAELPVIELCGPDAAAKRDIAAAACALQRLDLCVIATRQIPHTAVEIDVFVRLWDREAALRGSALLLECDEADGSEGLSEAVAAGLVDPLRSPLLVSTRGPREFGDRGVALLEVNPPTAQEQSDTWATALGAFPSLNGAAAALASQFSLSPAAIQSVAGQTEEGQPGGFDRLWDACRRHARPRLEGLAQRIEPAATWDDLVLPERQTQILRQIAIHVRQRAKVYQTWGFASRGSRGLGISALFAGPSGTGKTMAAEVLANELRLDLYRIDLSQVVSKYIGETEKNLRRVFDGAEAGAAVLLFDEADALFGKRSEVKDSHDRYANIEVSYLLQRMEAYRGLAILTTNRKSALDQAFLRRIRFAVEFPFPDAEQRREIWHRIFPAATPLEGLRIDSLARLNAAGGHIRNIAMGAAFLAADAGEPVRMSHLLSAARSEFAKQERPLTDAEVAGWE
jgi:hypothetical protein